MKKTKKTENEFAILTSSKGFPQTEPQASSPPQSDTTRMARHTEPCVARAGQEPRMHRANAGSSPSSFSPAQLVGIQMSQTGDKDALCFQSQPSTHPSCWTQHTPCKRETSRLYVHTSTSKPPPRTPSLNLTRNVALTWKEKLSSMGGSQPGRDYCSLSLLKQITHGQYISACQALSRSPCASPSCARTHQISLPPDSQSPLGSLFELHSQWNLVLAKATASGKQVLMAHQGSSSLPAGY